MNRKLGESHSVLMRIGTNGFFCGFFGFSSGLVDEVFNREGVSLTSLRSLFCENEYLELASSSLWSTKEAVWRTTGDGDFIAFFDSSGVSITWSLSLFGDEFYKWINCHENKIQRTFLCRIYLTAILDLTKRVCMFSDVMHYSQFTWVTFKVAQMTCENWANAQLCCCLHIDIWFTRRCSNFFGSVSWCESL